MHPTTDKLIREAVEYLLEGRYEKPKEKQIEAISTVGVYDATTSKRTVAAVSPIIQTGY